MKQQTNLRENLRKIIKMRERYIALFALLLVAFSKSLWSAEVDTVWVSDFVSEIRFQHPTSKNLVLEQFNNLKVLDSKNGELIREIPFKTDWQNIPYISPDGTKLLHTNLDEAYIYEYPSMQLVYKLDTCLYTKLINDNEIVYRKAGTLNLIKYNLITKESKIHTPDGSVKSIATSPDGRFIAYSLSSTDDIIKWSKLILMDAKSMQDIKILNEKSFSDFQFIDANFSFDGNFITFWGNDEKNKYGQIFLNTTTLKIEKNRIPIEDSLKGYINFLSNDIVALKIKTFDEVNSKDIYKTQIIDYKSDKILLTLNNTFGCIFNKELNHIYYLDYENKNTICLNISNLNTGITSPQLITIVKYQNKQLIINKENVQSIEISDISGRVILNKIIENPFSNNTILPLNLVNGSYLIKVITDKESFTHKLMIME